MAGHHRGGGHRGSHHRTSSAARQHIADALRGKRHPHRGRKTGRMTAAAEALRDRTGSRRTQPRKGRHRSSRHSASQHHAAMSTPRKRQPGPRHRIQQALHG